MFLSFRQSSSVHTNVVSGIIRLYSLRFLIRKTIAVIMRDINKMTTIIEGSKTLGSSWRATAGSVGTGRTFPPPLKTEKKFQCSSYKILKLTVNKS